MDNEISEALAAALFTPERETASYAMELGGGTLDIVRASRGGPVTLTLTMPGAEAAEPELERAWLEANWLRRQHDGVVAAADAEGRMVFGMILANDTVSGERLEAAAAALLAAADPGTEPPPPPAEAAAFESDLVWIKL
ncbi:hypothetical protein [Aureimonas leprariae]|uniref:Uncharacterized protein n=1 Tax=Plantimonas leprariae TaxID=2615207 RepID=A0A7V7TWQ0_9HYPH|nr:hypothetical protein [Aureimonas leprariae]KAB0679840.1 hypothetical protein F6X38_11480 [Aureimonas leprariae]